MIGRLVNFFIPIYQCMHNMQSVFKPIKNSLRKTVFEWNRSNPDKVITELEESSNPYMVIIKENFGAIPELRNA